MTHSHPRQTPVASASLAQVYKGTLHNGDVVAVKVQRPDLRHMVSRDLVVMARASEFYERFARSFSADQTDYQAVLGAWGRGFYSELDFEAEAASQQHFIDEVMPRVEGLYVPRVYHAYCGRRLLVTEWIDGTKLTDGTPEDIKPLVALGVRAFLTQLLDVGTFHADPHPGNLMVTPQGQLAYLDFGMMGSLDAPTRLGMIRLLVNFVNRDAAEVSRTSSYE